MDDAVLHDLRQSIDRIDSAFMFTLAERVRVLIKIGLVKQHLNLPFSYSAARKADLRKTMQLACDLSIKEDFMGDIFSTLYDYAQGMMQSSAWEGYMKSLILPPDSTLERLREHIFRLDQTLCYLLAERFALVRQVGQYKRQHGMPALVQSRWQSLLEDKLQMASTLGVDTQLTATIFEMMHVYALSLEQ